MTEAGRSPAWAEESDSSSSLPGLAVAGALLSTALMLGTVIVRSLDPGQFNYDVGWVLHFTSRLLDGAVIYADVIDENPPLIFWLSAPPVATARLLGAPPILVFNLFLALLACSSGALCHRVLRRGWPNAAPAHHLALATLVVGLELLAPGVDFGQRENVMLIAVLPYIFAAAARASGQRLPGPLAVAIGVGAGVGLAIKPHFGLMWIAVEITLLLSMHGEARSKGEGDLQQGRAVWLRTENVVIAAIQVGYLLAIVLFAPHYADAMEMSLRLLSAYKDFTLVQLLTPAAVLHVVLAAGVFALFEPSDLDLHLRRVLLTAAVALVIIAIAQGTNWGYHYLPASLTALLLVGVIALGLSTHGDTLRGVLRPRAAAIPLLALLMISIWSSSHLLSASRGAFGWTGEQRSLIRALTRSVSERAHGEAIWFMSTSVNPAFPVVNLTGARWASRFCCVWLVAGVYTPEEKAARPFPYHDPEDMTELERFQLDAVMEDLEADPPKLILIDENPYKQAFGKSDFRFLSFFRRDERFADFFMQYRRVDRIGTFHIYERGTASQGGGGEGGHT